MAFPAPAGGHYLLPEAGGRRDALHRLAERDVLHERDAGKTGKRFAAHEDRLVAGGDAAEARTPVHEEADHRQQLRPAGDADVETPPEAAPERRRNQRIGIRRQARIGVQEQQPPARGGGGTCVHLARAAARRLQYAIGEPGSKLAGTVLTAAVHDDDLVPPRAQRRQRMQRLRDGRRLVQRRNDDGDLHCRTSFSDQS